jgi:YegS/Rv2252/BmrU family lipid kinase
MIDHTASTWMVIVNPNAGYGKGKTDWMTISDILKEEQIAFAHVFTEQSGHAIELARQYVEEGYRNFIVVGGDGTLNETVNGIFSQSLCATHEITLAMIPVGTGNDWGRMFHIPHHYREAIKVIKKHAVRPHDVGSVTYIKDGVSRKRYFLNIAGLGFDAQVVKRTNHQKELGKHGKFIYLVSLMKCLVKHRHVPVKLKIDDTVTEKEIFTISIGIGKYSGGGMRQTPHALPDDGLFDMTVIQDLSIPAILWNLRRLYDGTILEQSRIDGYQGQIIHIEPREELWLEADGELLGHAPATFTIFPQSIQVIDHPLKA